MVSPQEGTRSLTCQDAIALLADYLEAALTAEQLGQLEAHLAICEPCQAYLRTYRRTGTLAARSERAEMPAEMRRRLRDFLLKSLAEGQTP